MAKTDQYYFTDSIFQLELNLHNIRRELIFMLEEFEKEDCFVCWQLKCRCVGTASGQNTSLASNASHGSGARSTDGTPSKAPPAESLPMPKFEKEAVKSDADGSKEIEAWIEASRKQKAKTDRRLQTDILLASLKSWGEARSEVKKERLLVDFEKDKAIFDPRLAAANAVEVFFNRFKVQPAVTSANMAYVTNVAAIYGKQKSKSSEYTYF